MPGNALLALKRLDEARADYTTALRLDPSLAIAYLNRAAVSMAQQQDQATLADYRSAIEHAPDFAPAHYQLERYYASLGRVEDAASALEAAIRLDPAARTWAHAHDEFNGLRGHPAIASLLGDVGLIMPVPETPLEFTCRGLRYEEIGEPSKAEADYTRALELDRGDTHARLHRRTYTLRRAG